MKTIKLLKAISLIKEADKMSVEERTALQKIHLNEIVKYAKENSPYFAKLYADIGENFSLYDLPITNRSLLIKNFNKWNTDRTITKSKIDEFMLDKSNIGKLFDDKYLVFTTSGSTGSPCIILFDKSAMNICSAISDIRVFNKKDELRKYILSGAKALALFADNGFYFSCSCIRYFQLNNPMLKHKVKSCDVRKPISDIVKTLNKYKPAMIMGYSTALDLLATEKEKGTLKIKPVIIMPGGENLHDDMRKHISKAFNCFVQTCYSCTECGILAYECSENHLHINDDWVILEAVDENNHHVPPGTQSAKILLTNLSNKVCPIIRFEITDRVIMHDEACPCGCTKPWITLEGRTDDIIYFDNGVQFAPMTLYSVIKEFEGIDRFQLIQQEDDSLELRLMAENKIEKYKQIKKRLSNFLHENGVDTEIFLSQNLPKANHITGRYKHIISKNITSDSHMIK